MSLHGLRFCVHIHMSCYNHSRSHCFRRRIRSHHYRIRAIKLSNNSYYSFFQLLSNTNIWNREKKCDNCCYFNAQKGRDCLNLPHHTGGCRESCSFPVLQTYFDILQCLQHWLKPLHRRSIHIHLILVLHISSLFSICIYCTLKFVSLSIINEFP